MGMITQDIIDIQEICEKVLPIVPTVSAKDTHCYILVRDLNDDLQKFIETGKTTTNESDDINAVSEIGVFSDADEKKLILSWQANEYEHMFKKQPLEYMHRRISVKYLIVRNPKTNISVSLIPWFMLPERPYPVFVYAYAEWHYEKSGRKSMRLSACAAGKIFGVNSFSKSTLSRVHNNKQVFNIHADRVQSADAPSCLPDASLAESVVELLENYPAMREPPAPDKGGQPSPPASNSEYIPHVFNSVPDELSKVIKDSPLPPRASGDTRKRPPRRSGTKRKHPKHLPDFIQSDQIERIRSSFIEECKAAVLDTATKYNKFLII